MKLSVLRKLRTRTLRRREKLAREMDLEPSTPLNLYRKRLEGRVQEADAVIDDIDRALKNHHDKWHDRRKK